MSMPRRGHCRRCAAPAPAAACSPSGCSVDARRQRSRSASRCGRTSAPVAATSTSCSTGCWRTPVASTTSTPRSQQRRASPARSSSPPPATASAPPVARWRSRRGGHCRRTGGGRGAPRRGRPRPRCCARRRSHCGGCRGDGSPARRRGRRPPRRQRPPVHGLLRGARPGPVDRREIGVELDPLVVRCDELVAIIAADDERIAELEAVVPDAGGRGVGRGGGGAQPADAAIDARCPRRRPRR